MNAELNELDALLLDWECGDISDADLQRLQEMLHSSEAAREHFAQYQALTAAMHLESDAGLAGAPDISLAKKTPPTPQPVFSTRNRWLLAVSAAALMLIAVCGWWAAPSFWQANNNTPLAALPSARDAGDEAQAHGVAILTRLVDARWKPGQQPLQTGEALKPGLFALESGHAQIEFFSGATVVVEGPAELQLQSATQARVRSGRLRAMVPPAARGFSLEVDDMKVVDLGTEFALSVSDQGSSVQVFDGEVQLHHPAAEKRLLTAGQALTRTAAGEFQPSDAKPQEFVDIAALASRADGQDNARFERWSTWSQQLRKDPRLVLYYAFDQPHAQQRRLPCSITPVNTDLDGAIVGARHVAGRWSQKTALEFKQPADRVRVNVPGEYGSLSFCCWVKIDSLDRWYNSLFLTDHYNQGEPHWQILDTGQLFFSVRSKADTDGKGGQLPGPTHHPVRSPSFWQPSMSGKWQHIATTYNARTGEVSHYLNGKLLHQETVPADLRVKTTRIGAASLGNWSSPTRPDAGFAIRNLNGSIDEFAIFAATLSATEIKDMYEHGAP